MKLWQKIVCAIGIVIVCVFAVVMCLLPHNGSRGMKCNALVVSVSDSSKVQYVTSNEIYQYIMKGGFNPVGRKMSEINFHDIEMFADSHPMVESAECFPNTKGQVRVNVSQRVPKFRVAGEKNFFVDRNREIMPVRATTATYLPVASGRISERMAKEELFDFIFWLEENSFWNAQVEQIYINHNLEVELIPRVGSGRILIGKLTDNYEQRLNKLKRLYEDSFQKTGWKEYKEIDLRFGGQIIGR